MKSTMSKQNLIIAVIIMILGAVVSYYGKTLIKAAGQPKNYDEICAQIAYRTAADADNLPVFVPVSSYYGFPAEFIAEKKPKVAELLFARRNTIFLPDTIAYAEAGKNECNILFTVRLPAGKTDLIYEYALTGSYVDYGDKFTWTEGIFHHVGTTESSPHNWSKAELAEKSRQLDEIYMADNPDCQGLNELWFTDNEYVTSTQMECPLYIFQYDNLNTEVVYSSKRTNQNE